MWINTKSSNNNNLNWNIIRLQLCLGILTIVPKLLSTRILFQDSNIVGVIDEMTLQKSIDRDIQLKQKWEVIF